MLKAYSEEEKTGNNDKAIFDYIYYKALPGYQVSINFDLFVKFEGKVQMIDIDC